MLFYKSLQNALSNFPFSNDYYTRNGKDPHILIMRGVFMEEQAVKEVLEVIETSL